MGFGNGRPRYWVYTHDENDEILDTLGEVEELNPAITLACDTIANTMVEDDMMTTTVRVVDNELDGGTTVWMAGPVKKGAVDD